MNNCRCEKKSFFDFMFNLHIWWCRFYRKLKYVGQDTYGNKYFEAPPIKGYKKNRRFVIYKRNIEASLVPPLWHAWLHHQRNEFPDCRDVQDYEWQKPHLPNMTGTSMANIPDGHILDIDNNNKCHKNAGDGYEAWSPD